MVKKTQVPKTATSKRTTIINSKGEASLSAAVICLLIEDVATYEKTCEKKWLKSQQMKKDEVERNAVDALQSAFYKNESMNLWVSLSDISLVALREYLTENFPKSCAMAGVA